MEPRVSLRVSRNTRRSFDEDGEDESFAESEDDYLDSLPASPELSPQRRPATRNRGKARVSYKEDSDEELVAEERRSLKRKRTTRAASEKSRPSKAQRPRKKRQLRAVGAPLRRNKSCRSQLDGADEPRTNFLPFSYNSL